jgi:hypothetical protein
VWIEDRVLALLAYLAMPLSPLSCFEVLPDSIAGTPPNCCRALHCNLHALEVGAVL